MAREDFYNIKDLGDMSSEEAKTPTSFTPPKRPYKSARSSKINLKTALILLVALLVLVALGVGAWLVSKNHKTPKAASQTHGIQPAPSSTSTSSTQKYVSNGSDLNLTFNYPSSWSVTPVSGDNTTDQTITLSSPLTSITNAQGVTITGRVTLTVRPGTATMNELNANNPVEATASTQIAYDSPTANQYQYPYLGFIHFSNGSSVAGAFEEIIITGTTQLTQGEAVTQGTLGGLDPIISAAFITCSTQACNSSGSLPLSITSTTWTNAPIFQQTLATFKSFQLN